MKERSPVKLFRITKDLLTGLDLVDAQHKELARRINRVLKAAQQDGDAVYLLPETFDFLRDYVVSHFMVEEELMDTYKYPHAQRHRLAHIQRRAWVQDMATKLQGREPQRELAMQINYHLVEWLTLHIPREDKVLITFLRDKAEREKNSTLLGLFKSLFGK